MISLAKASHSQIQIERTNTDKPSEKPKLELDIRVDEH
jgi:hypothetical protein